MKVLSGSGLMPALPGSPFYVQHKVRKIVVETIDDSTSEPGLPYFALVVNWTDAETLNIFAASAKERTQAIASYLTNATSQAV
jgi:hypothetical protein